MPNARTADPTKEDGRKTRWANAAERASTRYYENANGCWIWTGTVGANGYGYIQENHKYLLAHRVVFAAHNGAIGAGLVIDHICGVTRCVNPSHLRAVTQIENLQNQTVMSKRNTSGFRGVHYQKNRSAWCAYINVGGKKRHLGYFATAEAASEVAAAARLELYSVPGITTGRRTQQWQKVTHA